VGKGVSSPLNFIITTGMRLAQLGLVSWNGVKGGGNNWLVGPKQFREGDKREWERHALRVKNSMIPLVDAVPRGVDQYNNKEEKRVWENIARGGRQEEECGKRSPKGRKTN